jgi:HK97 family phage prohead protease
MLIKKYIVAEKSEANDAEQSIVGWGSKPVPDRDGELIESSAWKLEQYRKNPVLMLSHNYSTPPVGKCLWVKADSNGLKFKAKFANTDRGKEMYELYKGGFMNGFSVGFAVNKGGATDHPTDLRYKGLKRVYHDVNLLEISCVAIPACPEALIEQVKSGKIVSKQLKDELEHIIILKEEGCTDDIEIEEVTPIVPEKKETEIVNKPEITENYVRIPVGDHAGCKNVRTIEISAKEGIKALYCVDDKAVMTYMFDKERWDMEKAHKWIEDHKKDVENIVVPNDEPEQKKGDDSLDVLRVIEERLQLLEAKIGKASNVCPFGGEFGKDNGKLEQCGGCGSNEKCKESAGKEESGVEKKMLGTEGAPSVYDLMGLLSTAIWAKTSSGTQVQTADPMNVSPPPCHVVDFFPTAYPDGYVIYACYDKEAGVNRYFKTEYMYADGGCKLADESAPVDQSWVESKYKVEGIVKKEVVEEVDDEFPLDEVEHIELEEIEVKGVAVDEINISDDDIRKIMDGAIKKMVNIDPIHIDIKGIVDAAIRKAKGRVE